MKSFFEEYGFVILSAVVVIALIGMTTPVGDLIESNLESLVTTFTTSVNSKLSAL